ncbi:hypothetical protein [Arthrobacter sp. N199823]|nr:hypothetical protein [Arthrobacter sp. N199823]
MRAALLSIAYSARVRCTGRRAGTGTIPGSVLVHIHYALGLSPGTVET